MRHFMALHCVKEAAWSLRCYVALLLLQQEDLRRGAKLGNDQRYDL